MYRACGECAYSYMIVMPIPRDSSGYLTLYPTIYPLVLRRLRGVRRVEKY